MFDFIKKIFSGSSEAEEVEFEPEFRTKPCRSCGRPISYNPEWKQIPYYWYFPEGHEDKKPGVIVVDRVKEEIKITEIAEEDWERDIPPEEMNELVEAINQMKRERGDTDFVEPVTEFEHSIYYGDHAVSEIVKHLREGRVPKQGGQAWY